MVKFKQMQGQGQKMWCEKSSLAYNQVFTIIFSYAHCLPLVLNASQFSRSQTVHYSLSISHSDLLCHPRVNLPPGNRINWQSKCTLLTLSDAVNFGRCVPQASPPSPVIFCWLGCFMGINQVHRGEGGANMLLSWAMEQLTSLLVSRAVAVWFLFMLLLMSSFHLVCFSFFGNKI